MKRRFYVTAATSLAFGFITLNFSNCAKVAFENNLASKVDVFGGSIGSISIDGGNEFTKNQEVVATLNHASATEMYVTDVQDCSSGGEWEKYSSFKRWTLKARNQETKLFVKFREKTGSLVETSCSEDSIIHDDVAPLIVAPLNIPSFTKDISLNANFQVSDTLSGVASIQCKKDSGSFEPCQAQMALQALTEGVHKAEIVATDRAGNSTLPLAISFTVDLSPPVVQFNQAPSLRTSDLNAVLAFSGQDALSGLDHIECRLSDTSAWSTCSSPLNQVFVEGAQKFSIRGIDKVGNISQPVSHSWVIDRTAPSVRITKSPAGFTNVAIAQIEFSGVPGGKQIVRFECSLDSAAFSNCVSPLSTSALTEGSHKFSVRGYDDVGNVSQPALANWTLDLTGPIARIDSGPAAITNVVKADLAFSAIDAVSGIREIQCNLDNAGFAACTSPRALLALSEGNHSFQVRAIDNAGNTGAAVTHNWKIDSTKPSVVITKGPAAQVKDINADLEFVATDVAPGMIARIECRLDAAVDWETCVSPKSYVGLNQGSHSFQVRAIDTAGNISDVKMHSWFNDSIGPAINFGQQPIAVLPSGQLSKVQFTVVDAGVGVASVTCGLNGVFEACAVDSTKDYPNLQPGSYTFTVNAVDLLGNASSKQIAWKVELRTTNYVQTVPVISNNKADIIIVIDNSGSMGPEQANMASRFGTFLDQLSGLDWQVGIVTTDMTQDAPKKDGRLLEITGLAGQFKLSSSMGLAQAKQYFANTIQRPTSEGSGYEQGIAATYKAVLRNAQVASASNPNNGFLRSGAVLSVVVVTDADETNPAGTQTQNRPENLVNLVKNTYPGKAFGFHSIIVKPNDLSCLNLANANNEGYGYAYSSASALTGGVVGTVCSTDYGSQLTAMGKATVDLINSANLNCSPLDNNNDGLGDVQIITADGSAAPAYTISGLKITFAKALPAGNNQLKYACVTQ